MTLAALLALAVGRLLTLREPPLREPVRPAEACVEQWLPINDEDESLVDRVVAEEDESPPFKPDALCDFEARGFTRIERRLPFISPSLFDADESS